MPILNQAARRTPPGAGSKVTVGATSTTATDLSALKGQIVQFQATGASDTDVIHFRFGTSAVTASTADDLYLGDGETTEYYIDDDHTHFRAIASSASCTLHYASTGR